MWLRLEQLCLEPYALYTSNFDRTVCATEKTTKSHSCVWETFHNDMGSEIHINLKFDAHVLKRRRRRLLRCQYITSVKDSEGNVPGRSHASTMCGM